MALPIPPDNLTPIPNNPFYYPETNYLKGEYGPFIVGSGFSINNLTGTINVSSGGSGAPAILAGAGISVTSGTGTVTITNTGIRTVTAGAGIGVTVAGGNLNIVNTLPAPSTFGTVTTVNTGVGLTGGPITTSGTVALTLTGVSPGTYSNPTITVDSYGRITFASPGSPSGLGITATGPIAVTSTFPQNVSIQAASTAASGAVQLNDTVTSTSTTQAATANAVKVTHDVASQAQTDATAAAASATAAFSAASAAQATANTANTNSTTALATAVNAQNDATNALAAATSAQSDATTALATANSAQVTANTAVTTANSRIPCAAFTGVGQFLVGTGAGTFVTLNPGSNGRLLAANSACASGLEWVPQTTGTVTNIITGGGLTGGPISTTGTIALSNTGVTPGTYTNSAITVDAQGRITSASSGTAGGVTQIVAGTNVTISPVSGTGIVTINATGGGGGSGTVTSITAGTGLDGGTITTSGTIDLADTSVTPGSYANGSFTVDQQGRLTAASSGAAPVASVAVTAPITDTGTATAPNIGIQTATTGQLGAVQVGTNIDVAAGVISVKSSTTAQSGIVQLNDTVTSTSTTEALTAAQGKSLQDQINALSVTTNLTLAGTFDASTSQMLSVTASGTLAGFTVGSDIPAPAAGLTDYFVIVTTAGSYSPPGGGGPYTANQGDWFLCDGSTWQFLNVGTDLPVASTGTAGIVELADTAETQTGTDTTRAVTPAGAAATYVPIADFSAKGDLLAATAANTQVALPVGSDGEVLTACAASTTGLCWAPAATPSIPCACITGKGALVTGTAANTPTALPVGADSLVLTACSAAPEGLCWAPVPGASPATSTDFGTLKGCINGSAVYLGCQSGEPLGGNCKTAIGFEAGNGATFIDTALGACTLQASNSGGRNVAVGFRAMTNGGACGVAVGAYALQCTNGNAVRNTAVGYFAGCSVTDGDFNTLIGSSAGRSITTGTHNTFVGVNAACQMTGSCNTVIGENAGLTLNPTLNRYTLIGNGTRSAYFGPTATSWTFSSDERLKTDITALPVNGEQVVNSLRPVEFTWLDRETKEPLEGGTHCAVGFIAQEVQKTLKDNGLDHITNLVSEGVDEYLGLEQTALIPFLVKAVQELSTKVDSLQSELTALKANG